MNLLLLEHDEVAADGTARLTGPRAAHLIGVLKVAPGRTVRVGLADGPKGAGRVTRVGSADVGLHCVFEETVPERPPVDVLLALPRPKVMRRLWAQLAALGVGRITLVNAWKVERMYFDTHVLTPELYRPLLIEGLQQARDTRVPEVRIGRRFSALMNEMDSQTGSGGEARWLADPTAGRSPRQAVASRPAGAPLTRVLVAVGPEGGWTDRERASLEAHGFQGVSLGPRALRSDTACVALLALAHHVLREEKP